MSTRDHRRLTTGILSSAVTAFVLSGCGCDLATSTCGHAPLVQAENQKAGSTGWEGVFRGWAAEGDLAVWASPYAPRAGDTLDLFVRARRVPVSLELYRLGWYGGAGGRLYWSATDVAADTQVACSAPIPGPVTCPWKRTLALSTSPDWPSGMYLIRVIDSRSRSSYYPFVLSDGRPALFGVALNQLTWQAYNPYGGSSLYSADPTSPSRVGRFVSFERPYSALKGLMYLGQVVPVVHWLEASGQSVTYLSDAALAADRLDLPRFKGLIFAAHDEYWTWTMRDRVDALRDGGTHLVFLSRDNGSWNIRLSPGPVTGRPDEVITCWKGADPDARTTEEITTQFRFFPLDRPPNELQGIMHLSVTGYRQMPLVVSDSAVGPEARRFLAAAGLAAGDSIPNLVRWEGDRIFNNGFTPKDLQVLFRSPFDPPNFAQPDVFHTTFYVAPSGAGVFAAGSNGFGYGLEPDLTGYGSPKLQALMAAVLRWMATH